MKEALVELIASEVIKELSLKNTSNNKKIKVGVSGRHVHLSKDDLEILFGKGYKLRKKKYLMGDQFAAEEMVTIIGKKLKGIEKVRVLGPIREETQVEISKTDSIVLGINPPLRLSGDIKESSEIVIVGPKGVVKKDSGCIIAKRHIHMSNIDSKVLGIKEGSVSVRFNGERAAILEEVDVRIRGDFDLEMHIDTDEANALNIKNGDFVEIINSY